MPRRANTRSAASARKAAPRPGVALHRRHRQLPVRGQDLEDEVVHRLDVAPRFLGGMGRCLDHVEVDAVRPEVGAAGQHQHADRSAAGRRDRIAERQALRRAHRAVAEGEVQHADATALLVAHRAPGGAVDHGIRGERQVRDAGEPLAKDLHGRQLERRARVRVDALQMGDPDRAVDRPAQDCAVAGRHDGRREPRPRNARRAALPGARRTGGRACPARRRARRASRPRRGPCAGWSRCRRATSRWPGRPAASPAATGRERRAACRRAAAAARRDRSARSPRAPPRRRPRSPRCGTGCPSTPRASERSASPRCRRRPSRRSPRARSRPTPARPAAPPSRAPRGRGRPRCRGARRGNDAAATPTREWPACRNGATISSGRASATASSVTRSLTSSSSVRSWPSRASSAQRRCVRLLNAWLRMRTRISRSAAAARRRASRRCGGRRSACPSARSGADPRSPRR